MFQGKPRGGYGFGCRCTQSTSLVFEFRHQEHQGRAEQEGGSQGWLLPTCHPERTGSLNALGFDARLRHSALATRPTLWGRQPLPRSDA